MNNLEILVYLNCELSKRLKHVTSLKHVMTHVTIVLRKLLSLLLNQVLSDFHFYQIFLPKLSSYDSSVSKKFYRGCCIIAIYSKPRRFVLGMRSRQFVVGLEFDVHQENIHLADYYFDNHHWHLVFKLKKWCLLGGALKFKVSTS